VRLEPEEFGDVGFLGEGCGALFFVLGDAFGYGAGYADMEDSVFSGHEVDGAARKKGREKEKAKERKSKRKRREIPPSAADRPRPSRLRVKKTDGRKKSAAALGMTSVGYRSRKPDSRWRDTVVSVSS
jgi:hypothetical protein